MIKTAKIVSMFLVIVLIFSMSLSCYANEIDTPIDDEIIEEYQNINSLRANITVSGLSANCTARLVAKSSMSLNIKMYLQKLSSGSYTTVQTWTSSTTGTSLTMSKSKIINPLSTYRLKVIFTAGSESTTVYKYP